MAQRKGLGKGMGRGYKNIIPKDPVVHSMSSKGIKQPQKLSPITRINASPFKSYSTAGQLVADLREMGFNLSFQNMRKEVVISHKNIPRPKRVVLSENDTWTEYFEREKETFIDLAFPFKRTVWTDNQIKEEYHFEMGFKTHKRASITVLKRPFDEWQITGDAYLTKEIGLGKEEALAKKIKSFGQIYKNKKTAMKKLIQLKEEFAQLLGRKTFIDAK